MATRTVLGHRPHERPRIIGLEADGGGQIPGLEKEALLHLFVQTRVVGDAHEDPTPGTDDADELGDRCVPIGDQVQHVTQVRPLHGSCAEREACGIGDGEADPAARDLLSEALQHRLRQVDAVNMQSMLHEGQRHQACADPDLQHAFAITQLEGQQIRRRP